MLQTLHNLWVLSSRPKKKKALLKPLVTLQGIAHAACSEHSALPWSLLFPAPQAAPCRLAVWHHYLLR